MKAINLTNLSFENTTDDCLLQQGAGGGYGATLSGGTTIKATRSSTNVKSKSNVRERANSGETRAFGAPAGSSKANKMAKARQKAAAAAAGTVGTGTFIGKPATGKGSRKIKTAFVA